MRHRLAPPVPSPALSFALAVALLLVVTPVAHTSVGSLRSGIAADRVRENALSGRAVAASRTIALLGRQTAILQQRIAGVQAQLDADRARLVSLQADESTQRARTADLHRRWAADRGVLARWLVAMYEGGRPDAIEGVLSSHGFQDLLERLDFLRRIADEGAGVTAATLRAHDAARRATVRLHGMSVQQAAVVDAAAREAQALGSMRAQLAARSAALATARRLALAGAAAARSDRARLQKKLDSELASLGSGAPGGPWAIPAPIVQCESGGQNLPPNGAGASGYYQIVPGTWKAFGGTTAQAYQAPKAEQDAVAGRIWNGGAGASNWVCAALVGA